MPRCIRGTEKLRERFFSTKEWWVNMASTTKLLVVIWMAGFVGYTENTTDICRGARCVGAGNGPCGRGHCQGPEGFAFRHLTRSTQDSTAPDTARTHHRNFPQNRPAFPYTIIRPQHGKVDGARQNPSTITAEVYNPGCKTTGCNNRGPSKPSNATKDCKSIECKLPFGIRPNPKPGSCAGGDCQTVAGFAERRPTFVHMQDRAEQVLGDLPEIGHIDSDRGEDPLGIQLNCDVKPGSNEMPSEDTLVLQLRLAQGQENLVKVLQAQQEEIGRLQGRLMEQQGVLVAQQREILEQHRQMFEQMERVKAQCSSLLDSVRHTAFWGNTGGSPETRPEGLGLREESLVREAYAKVEVEAGEMDAGRPPLACSSCEDDEYCDYHGDGPHCERCTVCPPGFFLVSQCSLSADRICQDRDECLEISNLCREHGKCLNTAGGFQCTNMSVKEAASGRCGHGYFYSLEMRECQACSECDSQPTASPCSALSDTACGGPSGARLSLSWSSNITPPRAGGFQSMRLPLQGPADVTMATVTADGWLVLQQHGLVWVDLNLALRHRCPSFIQACLQLNGSDATARDLGGVRVEQREGGPLQSVSASGAFAAEPGDRLAPVLRSTSHRCDGEGGSAHLQGGLVSPFSLLWISHDTGSVAMVAQAVASAQFYANYRPAFRVSYVSDPYVVGLSHDGRGVRFVEKGTVKFVLQQALYSMGQACVAEGFHLVAYIDRNGNTSELMRVFKPGAHYRDTSVSLSAAATVDAGDTISFEILAPAQCNVRYFSDDSEISALSLVWVPSAVSSVTTASVSHAGLPTGAVRNKPLLFRQTSPTVAQVELAGAGRRHPRRNFIFREEGTASVTLDLKLIHSCSMIKLTLFQQAGPHEERPTAVARQVGGQMPEGSEWASVGMRASFPVRNGTEVFVTVDCVRGRLNQVAHEAGSGISIFWTAA